MTGLYRVSWTATVDGVAVKFSKLISVDSEEAAIAEVKAKYPDAKIRSVSQLR